MREVAETHEQLFHEHADLYGPNVGTKVKRCLAVEDAAYEAAVGCRERLREDYTQLFERFDLLLTPTVSLDPPPDDVDELTVREQAISLTIPFNAVGAPALSIPWAAAPYGALQVVAAPQRDGLVLAAGELLERERGATRGPL